MINRNNLVTILVDKEKAMSLNRVSIWILVLSQFGSLAQDNNTVRLAEGTTTTSGRVEIYLNGQWGTVCDDSWDISDAAVVCRQLGFKAAIEEFRHAWFGEGTGPIHMDEVKCTGNEISLLDCHYKSEHNCQHGEDAGVNCLPYDNNTVRLAEGTTTAGRVEIYLNGQWGTVCDDSWDLLDAAVICRQLGFKAATKAFSNARFGEGTGPIHFDDVECTGNEVSLLDCSFTSEDNCDHSKDVGVSCLPFVNGEIRLAGGNASAGRVEVYFDDQWGTVCDDDWDIDDASVVCRNIGFKGALYALKNAAFGEGEGLIHIDAVKCSGDERSLLACEYKRNSDCNHHEDASVVCLTSEEGTSHEETTDASLVITVLSVCLIAILLCAIVAATVHCVSRRERKRKEKLRTEIDVSAFGPLPDTPTTGGPFVDMVRLESAANPQKESKKITCASKRSTGSSPSETYSYYMSVIEESDNKDSEGYEQMKYLK